MLKTYNNFHSIPIAFFKMSNKINLQIVALFILMLNMFKNLQSFTIDIFVLGTEKYVKRLIFDMFFQSLTPAVLNLST